MITESLSLPAATLAATTAARETTRFQPQPGSPIAGEQPQSDTARTGRGRLGRRLMHMVAALATVAAVTLGGAFSGTASAHALEIQNGDQSWISLGWYIDYYWDGYQMVPWYVTMWSPPAGAGRLYCWWQTADCWWEQHPWRQY
jgi:hypothetical protein